MGILEYTRVYTKKVSKEELLHYLNNHTKKEAAEHFSVCIGRIYKYIKLYSINLNSNL